MKQLPKTVRLIATDFRSLECEEEMTQQFTEANDCPITRALNRLYPDSNAVSCVYYTRFYGEDIRTVRAGHDEVKKAWESLHRGSQYAIIRLRHY